MSFVLTPAYGRDYKSAADAVAAFVGGADFEHASARFTGGGSYIDRASIPDGARVQLRFKQLRGVVSFIRGREPQPRAKRVGGRTVALFPLNLAAKPVPVQAFLYRQEREGAAWRLRFKCGRWCHVQRFAFDPRNPCELREVS